MLKKLLKYDLKNLYKLLLVFYSLLLVGAFLTRIFFSIENSLLFNIIAQICSGFTISMMINVIINSLTRSWVRFSKNFYGDESYLTHTLPVTKKTHYMSKFLSSIIAMFTTIFLIFISLFIAYYSKENIEFLKSFLLPTFNAFNISMIKIIILFLIVLFLEMIVLLQAGFTGTILGHQKNNNKTIYSIVFSFITYMIIQAIVLFILFISSLFNSEIMNLFITSQINSIDILFTIIYLSIFTYSLLSILIYFVNIKLFNKGVNVD